MNAKLADVVILADSEQSKFEEIRLITAKAHFLDQVIHQIPQDLLIMMDGPGIQRCVINLIKTQPVLVNQHVNFDTVPYTVCIALETLSDENATQFAAECLIEALEALPEKRGIYRFGLPIKYSVQDLESILNWH